MGKVYLFNIGLALFFLTLCLTKIASQDVVPPSVLLTPEDIAVSCDQNTEGELNSWYTNGQGGLLAVDDVSSVNYFNSLGDRDVFDVFDSLLNNDCNTVVSLPVSFWALDNSGNSTDTFRVSFSFTDTVQPIIIVEPENVLLSCDIGVADSLTSWIKNAAGTVAMDPCRGDVSWTSFQWSSGGRSGNGTLADGPFEILDPSICDQSIQFSFDGADACGSDISFSASFELFTDSLAIQIDSLPEGLVLSCSDDVVTVVTNWYNDNGGMRASSFVSTVEINADRTLDSLLNEISESSSFCSEVTLDVSFTAIDTFDVTSSTLVSSILITDTGSPSFSNSTASLTLSCAAENLPSQLEDWIKSYAGAEAIDDCSDTVIWTTFTWSSDTRGGSGTFVAGPFGNIINTTMCSQDIDFVFNVEDPCGNSSSVSAVFTIVDTALVIEAPATDITFACERIPDPTTFLTNWYNTSAGFLASSAGNPLTILASKTLQETLDEFESSMMDNCNEGLVTVGFFGSDTLGNRTETSFATFSSIDTLGPVITSSPENIEFDCGAVDSLMVQSWLQTFGNAEASDVCSDSLTWTMFSWQSSTGGSGSGNFETGPFTILDGTDCFESAQVTFEVMDACGNISTTVATFSIQDTTPLMDVIPPVITTSPSSVNTNCEINILDSLESWYNNFGGLMATDENGVIKLRATKSLNITIQDFNASDTQTDCTNGNVSVGYYALDTLNNSTDTITVTFSAVDTIAPVIVQSATDFDMACDVGKQDSLTNWLRRRGGAVAMDDCAGSNVIWRQFGWADSRGNSGSGTIVNGPFNFIPDSLCSWSVDVTFTGQDPCGNSTTTDATFSIFDDAAPVFSLVLQDTTFNCDNVPSASSVIAMDGCEGQIMAVVRDSTTQNPDQNSCEFFNFQLFRTYTATDQCGNSESFTQIITVSDTLEPRFEAPVDITISCMQNTDPAITGEPINIIDNCSSEVNITFNDSQTGEGCDVRIIRTWEIRDICGSSLILPQTITIRDTIPPTISTPASDVEMVCIVDMNFEDAFADWVVNMGGASATDECSSLSQSFAAVPGSYDLLDPLSFPGDAPGVLDLVACPSSEMGTARFETVDFVFVDDCGNATVSSASFKILDMDPPTLSNIPRDTSYRIMDATACSLDIVIPAIGVEDVCGGVSSVFTTSDRYTIASNESGSEQVPVDSFRARFGPFNPSTITLESIIDLNVMMINIDADDPTEYFNIIAEDGTDLGRTPNTFAQCGDTTFTLDITNQQFLDWSSDDGFVEIDFIPNVPEGLSGALAINDVCFGAGTRVLFNLNIDLDVDGVFGYRIQIDDETPIELDAIENFVTSISSGTHKITYIVSDCAGNIATDSYQINITESGFPSVTCPANESAALPTGSCTSDYNLPISFTANDNCALADTFLYSVNGATEIAMTSFAADQNPIATLNKGANVVTYIVSDRSGNTATCTFNVALEDQEAPQIQCLQNSVVQVHPSGILPLIIEPEDVLDTFVDNCDIITYEYQNIDYSCNDIGTVVPVTVIATDESGNSSQCVTNARISAYTVQPIAQSLICAGDTLRLAANVPSVDGSNVYAFSWIGPNNFASAEENPIVPNASTAFSGVYSLTVTGANDCVSTGSVEVLIENFNTPAIGASADIICEGDSVIFTSTEYQSAVAYKWYTGVPPQGNLITTTEVPTFQFSPTVGSNSFYVVAENIACETSPSAPLSIAINAVPQVVINDTILNVCERGTFQLGTTYVGGINTNYRWIGPNGFSFNNANPPIFENVTLAQSGDYTLIIEENGCESAPVSTRVTVQALPDRPSINADNFVCEGDNLVLFLADTVDNQGTANWLLNGSFFQSVNGNGLIVQNIADSLEGLWQVYIQDGMCRSDTSNGVLITIEDALDIAILNDTLLCETDDVVLMTNNIPNATYEWRGPNNFRSFDQSPTAIITAGTYSVSVTTEAGCVNTASIDITTVERPRVIDVQNNIEECADGFGSIFIIPEVGPDSNYTFEWRGPDGFISTEEVLVFNEFTSNISGEYFLTVSSDICDSETEIININLTDVPQVPELGENIQACVGEFVTLTILNPEEGVDRYQWTTPMGVFETTEPQFEVPSIGLTNAGIYFVTSERNGCMSERSDPLNLNVFTIPGAPGVTSNAPVCAGEDLVLQATQILNAQYEWIGPNGFTSTGSRAVVRNVNEASEGDYSVRIILNGCPSEFRVLQDVEVLPQPATPTTESEELDICSDVIMPVMFCLDPATFDPDGDYIWTNLTTDTILGRTSSRCLSVDNIDLFAIGENRIVVIRQGAICPSEPSEVLSFVVSEQLNAIADAGQDIIACDVTNIELNASNPAQGTGRWTAIDPVIRFSDDTDPQSFVFDIREGNNILIWQLENGACIGDTDTLIVATEEDLEAVDDDINTPYETELVFDPLLNDVVPDAVDIQVIRAPIAGSLVLDNQGQFVYTPPLGYIGIVEVEYEACSRNCTDNCDRAIAFIEVGNVMDCFAPSLITPNGDGINDAFVIPCLESGLYPDNQLYIYNQYGDQVLDAPSYQNDWEGTYKGEDLPTGTYYFVFRANDELAPEKGFLIIER